MLAGFDILPLCSLFSLCPLNPCLCWGATQPTPLQGPGPGSMCALGSFQPGLGLLFTAPPLALLRRGLCGERGGDFGLGAALNLGHQQWCSSSLFCGKGLCMQLAQLCPSLFSNGAANPCISLFSTVLHEYVPFHSCRGHLLLVLSLPTTRVSLGGSFNDYDAA